MERMARCLDKIQQFQNQGWNIVRSICTVGQTRTGIRSTAVPLTVLQNLGDRVVGVNFVPFIRSRDVGFTARGMRPKH